MTVNLAKFDTLNGRYKIEHEHASPDTYVNYYVAQDLLLQRTVLVKVVADSSNEHFMARFEHEARILAKLEHPHVVPIYDYGVQDGHAYQIQRFLLGGKLDDYLAEHPEGMPASSAMRFAQQLGSALDYVHHHGIVHRNVDGVNVVLDEHLEPYLTNFALAKLYEDSQKAKPSKENVNSDSAIDLYAFGLLLFQALTGRAPSIKYDEVVERINDYRSDLPVGVDVVINRLMRTERNERYPKAAEAVEALFKVFSSGQANVQGKVFISYARADSEFVYKLARELQRVGVEIWIDQDIQPGGNWDQMVEDALDECAMMVLIASPASMKSENVQDEWSYFLEEGKVVYPFLYQETNLPFRLRRRQYIRSTDDILADVARIVDMLAGGTPTKLSGGQEE